MALTTMESESVGYCSVDLELGNNLYSRVQFGILQNLCSDVILRYEFQKEHKNLVFQYGGNKEDLVVSNKNSSCALTAAQITIPSLFSSIPDNVQPIATKSRRFSEDDRSLLIVIYHVCYPKA